MTAAVAAAAVVDHVATAWRTGHATSSGLSVKARDDILGFFLIAVFFITAVGEVLLLKSECFLRAAYRPVPDAIPSIASL
jgi:hypothetical protein